MSRGKGNPKRKHKENTTNDSLATEDFWNKESTLAEFHRVIKQKPCGFLKYMTISKIQSQLSERLKMDVPSKVIWSYLHARWNMNEEDDLHKHELRTILKTIKKKDFDLPKTEEWTRLIKEQGDLIDSINTNTDGNEANKSSCDQ